MSKIEIKKISIIESQTDCIVNAANNGLFQGGGVCGAIFRAAGPAELTRACNEIGHCDTGKAVVTPAFRLPAKYIIHAVGPRWRGGHEGEPDRLFEAYTNSLDLAKKLDCHSITFPLISAGIFGYPLKPAWRQAIRACDSFIKRNPDYEMDIIFAVLEDRILEAGQQTMENLHA